MYEAKYSGLELIKRSFPLGIFCQTLFKCFVLIYRADTYQKLVERIHLLYRLKDQLSSEVLTKKVKLCEKIYNIISFVNSSAVLIFIGYPIIKLILSNQYTVMFPIFYPFLDPGHFVGYLVTYLLHSILIIYTLLFHNAFDIAFVFFTVHAVAIVDLIKIEYDDITDYLGKCKIDSVDDMKHARQKLKGIVEAQKVFDEYVDDYNRLYQWPCFVTSSTSTFTICMALVLILIVKWPLAYGLCWALFGQLFAAYMNGEVIDLQVGYLLVVLSQ